MRALFLEIVEEWDCEKKHIDHIKEESLFDYLGNLCNFHSRGAADSIDYRFKPIQLTAKIIIYTTFIPLIFVILIFHVAYVHIVSQFPQILHKDSSQTNKILKASTSSSQIVMQHTRSKLTNPSITALDKKPA